MKYKTINRFHIFHIYIFLKGDQRFIATRKRSTTGKTKTEERDTYLQTCHHRNKQQGKSLPNQKDLPYTHQLAKRAYVLPC